MRELGADRALRDTLGRQGAADVARLTWDNAAAQQGRLYAAAVQGTRTVAER